MPLASKNPVRLDDTLTAAERDLIADHHNHRKPVTECRNCYEKVEVHCPTCNNPVLPWTLVETEVFSTR